MILPRSVEAEISYGGLTLVIKGHEGPTATSFSVSAKDAQMEYHAYGRNGTHVGVTGQINIFKDTGETPDYAEYGDKS